MFASRRRFSQGLGASLALAALQRPALADDTQSIVEVRISDFAFVPKRLEISSGDIVIWTNDDLVPHTATALDGSWETETITTGNKARLVFSTPGDFDYVCAFHPHMTGFISIRPKNGG